ncbi:hypothetical protein Tco_0856849 [Tanacetum coccineum]|uniref:Uncharacterized protein n=1 Tax=Tanacetum coccineum TaxID=301880 RepID=A0ABQ5B800_9ASTR
MAQALKAQRRRCPLNKGGSAELNISTASCEVDLFLVLSSGISMGSSCHERKMQYDDNSHYGNRARYNILRDVLIQTGRLYRQWMTAHSVKGQVGADVAAIYGWRQTRYLSCAME